MSAVAVRKSERVRTTEPEDVRELKWYFAQGGLSVFGSSTFGVQLDRAALFAFGGYDCKRCRGSGFVSSTKQKRQANERQAELLRMVGIDPKKLLAPAADRVCAKCDGMGWVARTRKRHDSGPLTARMTGSSKHGGAGGVDVGDVNLARMGAVQARLTRLFEASPTLHTALEAYYSPDGGSLLALYAMTAAGRKLLRKNPLGLPARQLIANEVADQKDKPNPNRRALLAAAEQDAQDLHRSAVEGWNLTRRTKPADVSNRAERLLAGGAL